MAFNEFGGCKKTICPVENLFPMKGKHTSPCVTDEQLGFLLGCQSACSLYRSPQTCCTHPYNLSSTCQPSSKFLKTLCNDAYTYAYDDTANVICDPGKHGFMNITFCPIPSINQL